MIPINERKVIFGFFIPIRRAQSYKIMKSPSGTIIANYVRNYYMTKKRQ